MKFDLSCLYKQLAPRFKKSWEASPKWIISHPKLTHMFLNAWLLSKDKQLIETYWSKNTSWTRITRRYTKRGNPRKPRSYGCTNARKMFAKGLRSKIILRACVNFTLVKRRKKLTNKHRSVHFQYETRKRLQMLHGWTRFLKMQKNFSQWYSYWSHFDHRVLTRNTPVRAINALIWARNTLVWARNTLERDWRILH